MPAKKILDTSYTRSIVQTSTNGVGKTSICYNAMHFVLRLSPSSNSIISTTYINCTRTADVRVPPAIVSMSSDVNAQLRCSENMVLRMRVRIDSQCTSSFQVSSSVDSGSPMTPDLQTSVAEASLTEGTKESVLTVTLPSGEDCGGGIRVNSKPMLRRLASRDGRTNLVADAVADLVAADPPRDLGVGAGADGAAAHVVAAAGRERLTRVQDAHVRGADCNSNHVLSR